MGHDLKNLAIWVDVYKEKLDINDADVNAAGGPSTTTLSKWRKGVGGELQRRTRRGLEDALQWERGSVKDVLDGGEPTPLRRGADDRLSQLLREAGVPAEAVAEVIRKMRDESA